MSLTEALSYVLSPTPTAMTGRPWKNSTKKEKNYKNSFSYCFERCLFRFLIIIITSTT